jgi:hypothetical protein
MGRGSFTTEDRREPGETKEGKMEYLSRRGLGIRYDAAGWSGKRSTGE